MNKTRLVKCECKNEFQDKRYGVGMRVTTPNNTEQSKGRFVVRCTVCSREHFLGVIK